MELIYKVRTFSLLTSRFSQINHLAQEPTDSSEISPLRKYVLFSNSLRSMRSSAFGLIDVMQSSPHVVRCIGIGSVMSAAFLIFAAADRGQRYAAKYTSFMCHQFSENMENKYHDLKATMRENDICNDKMINILKEATGLAPSVIKKKLLPPSDVYLTAQEVLDVGIADHILE